MVKPPPFTSNVNSAIGKDAVLSPTTGVRQDWTTPLKERILGQRELENMINKVKGGLLQRIEQRERLQYAGLENLDTSDPNKETTTQKASEI